MRTAGYLLSAGKEGQKQQVRRGWQGGEELRRPCSRAWTLSQGDLLFRGHHLPMKPPTWDAHLSQVPRSGCEGLPACWQQRPKVEGPGRRWSQGDLAAHTVSLPVP